MVFEIRHFSRQKSESISTLRLGKQGMDDS